MPFFEGIAAVWPRRAENATRKEKETTDTRWRWRDRDSRSREKLLRSSSGRK